MDFDLSEEQRALRRTIRDFALAEIAPHSAAWDARAAMLPDFRSTLSPIPNTAIRRVEAIVTSRSVIPARRFI